MTRSRENLTEQVLKIIDSVEASSMAENDKALRDAEALAEKYKDVRPAPFAVPMEKFFGLPAFSK